MDTFLSISFYSVLVLVGLSGVGAAFVYVANALVEETEEPDGH